MKLHLTRLSACIIAALSFQATASALKPGDSRLAIGLEASTMSVDNELLTKSLSVKTLGLNFGGEFGLNSVVSFKPQISLGRGITSEKRHGDKFDLTYYTRLALDTNFYLPQVDGLYFHAAPTYFRYHGKTTGHHSKRENTNYGFGFHTGLAYQLNDSIEMGIAFEKDYLRKDEDVQSWNLNISYLF